MPFIPSNMKRAGEPTEFSMRQAALSPVRKYDIFARDNSLVYSIEGDIAQLGLTLRQGSSDIVKLKRKIGSLRLKYTIIRNGEEAGFIEKDSIMRSSADASGTLLGRKLVIKSHDRARRFDIGLDNVMICQVNHVHSGMLSETFEIISFDKEMQDVSAALAAVCDRLHEIRYSCEEDN
ncbi:MAG: hypothetical protein II695_01305 [Oscillospiraceae bacterium]|jgi:uncharacterized protein YxjI|nr:hypothetical protein [Oscillospiraceae bacterium]